MPSSSRARRRSDNVRGLMPAHECSSSENRRGPSERSWTSSAVHFAPMISAHAATEQLSSWMALIVRMRSSDLTPAIVGPTDAGGVVARILTDVRATRTSSRSASQATALLLRFFALGDGLELVADAVARLDERMARRDAVDLVAQPPDEDVDGPVPVCFPPAPDLLQQLVASGHTSAVE